MRVRDAADLERIREMVTAEEQHEQTIAATAEVSD